MKNAAFQFEMINNVFHFDSVTRSAKISLSCWSKYKFLWVCHPLSTFLILSLDCFRTTDYLHFSCFQRLIPKHLLWQPPPIASPSTWDPTEAAPAPVMCFKFIWYLFVCAGSCLIRCSYCLQRLCFSGALLRKCVKKKLSLKTYINLDIPGSSYVQATELHNSANDRCNATFLQQFGFFLTTVNHDYVILHWKMSFRWLDSRANLSFHLSLLNICYQELPRLKDVLHSAVTEQFSKCVMFYFWTGKVSLKLFPAIFRVDRRVGMTTEQYFEVFLLDKISWTTNICITFLTNLWSNSTISTIFPSRFLLTCDLTRYIHTVSYWLMIWQHVCAVVATPSIGFIFCV